MEIHQRLSGCSYKTGISERFSTTLHKIQAEHRLCKMRKKNMPFHIQVDYGSFETWGFLKSVSQDQNKRISIYSKEGWIVGQDKPAHCKPIRWHPKKDNDSQFYHGFWASFLILMVCHDVSCRFPRLQWRLCPNRWERSEVFPSNCVICRFLYYTSLLVCLYYKRIINIRKLILYDHKTHTIYMYLIIYYFCDYIS